MSHPSALPRRLTLDVIIGDRVDEVVELNEHLVEADVHCWDGRDRAGGRWRAAENSVGWTMFGESLMFPACLSIISEQPLWMRGQAQLNGSPECQVVLSVYDHV